MKKDMNLKETLLSTLVNGKEVLEDIAVTRRNSVSPAVRKNEVAEVLAKLHPAKLHLIVSEIFTEGENAKIFRFVSKTGYLPPFEAGQYLNVFAEIEGIRTSRPYSLSSSPKQTAYYEITIARTQNGFVSDYFLDRVKTGDVFEANGPSGVFRFNPVFHSKKSVFLAGGSGITPFMSMTREILENGKDREVFLLYGSRTESAALFASELEHMAQTFCNFHYQLIVSDEPAYKGKKGFIDAACIREFTGSTDDCTCYVCGPLVMSDFCTKALAELGVKPKDVRREVFASRPDIWNESGWPEGVAKDAVFNVKVAGKTIEAKACESLLVALERAGIRVNVCCRSGECSLCRVRITGGKVFMPRGVLLRLADEKFGYVHSCKAYPISNLEVAL